MPRRCIWCLYAVVHHSYSLTSHMGPSENHFKSGRSEIAFSVYRGEQ
jgi:hypothetical protein